MCLLGLFAVLILVGIVSFACDGAVVLTDIDVVFIAGITSAVGRGRPHADNLLVSNDAFKWGF